MSSSSASAPSGSAPTQSGGVLAIYPMVPWPARQNGISIRHYPLLWELSGRHRVDVVILGQRAEAMPADPIISRLASVRFSDFDPRAQIPLWKRLRLVAKLLTSWNEPYAYASYFIDEVRRFLQPVLREHRYECVLWIGRLYRQALDQLAERIPETRIVWDCVDSPYLTYLRGVREAGPLSLLRRLDLGRARRWERRACENVDATVFVSPVDAAATGQVGRFTSVIPNGVYIKDFTASAVTPSRPTIGYLGHMGYPPNISAALRLHNDIYSRVRVAVPDAQLLIIGREPVDSIRALAGAQVTVTGEVPVIWDRIAEVSVFVFPLISGAGLQNKVLEAMYAGRPVITTHLCNASVGAENGVEIFAADDDEEIARITIRLLEDPELAREVGRRGREFVEKRFDSRQVLRQFESLLMLD